MIAVAEDAIRTRATALAGALAQDGVRAGVEPVQATIGGGSLPGETLPSWAVVLFPIIGEGVDTLARRLRQGDPGIFGRIDQDRLVLDLRTVLPEDDGILLRSLRQSLGA
jgi:L-seryl-tRNA(Ser) seleniumtransferase